MDFGIIDTFSRPDHAGKSGARAADDVTESFADVLDAKMRPEQPERPERPERPEQPERSERAQAPADRPERSERPDQPDRPQRPEQAEASARPANKPEQHSERPENSEAPVADQVEGAPLTENSEAPKSEAAAPSGDALPADLLAALLTNGEMPAGQSAALLPPELIPTVPAQPIVAPVIVALLTETPAVPTAPTATAPVLPAMPAPAAATAPEAATAPAPAQPPGTKPQFTVPTATTQAPSEANATPATAAPTPTQTAAPAAQTVLPTTPAPVSAEQAVLAAVSASLVVETETVDAEPTPLFAGDETVETLLPSTGSATSAPAAVSRPASTPASAAGYAAQLASQEQPVEAPKPGNSHETGKAALDDALPLPTDLAAEAGDDLPGLKSGDSTFASALAENNRSTATTTIENVAHRAGRAAALPVAEQVAVKITKALSDGVDRISVKLNPAELGQIEVRMEIGPDGKFNAVFAADRPQTLELLQRDARELARSLQDAGLRADSGSLSFNLRGQGNGQHNASAFAAMHDSRGSGLSVDGLETTAPTPTPAYGRSDLGAGRVDIRV